MGSLALASRSLPNQAQPTTLLTTLHPSIHPSLQSQLPLKVLSIDGETCVVSDGISISGMLTEPLCCHERATLKIVRQGCSFELRLSDFHTQISHHERANTRRITLQSHYHVPSRAPWQSVPLTARDDPRFQPDLEVESGASHRPTAGCRLTCRGRKPITQIQRIRPHASIFLSVRYLARSSWRREREVHPAARWSSPPVKPICYLKPYSRKFAHDGRHSG